MSLEGKKKKKLFFCVMHRFNIYFRENFVKGQIKLIIY